MSGNIAVALLETVVLLDVMEVVTSNNDSSLHFVSLDNTFENTTADADVASERAVLVDISTLDSFFGGLESQAYVLVITVPLSSSTFLAEDTTGTQEDGLLLLEGLLVL
jgi:hypothetical protein